MTHPGAIRHGAGCRGAESRSIWSGAGTRARRAASGARRKSGLAAGEFGLGLFAACGAASSAAFFGWGRALEFERHSECASFAGHGVLVSWRHADELDADTNSGEAVANFTADVNRMT